MRYIGLHRLHLVIERKHDASLQHREPAIKKPTCVYDEGVSAIPPLGHIQLHSHCSPLRHKQMTPTLTRMVFSYSLQTKITETGDPIRSNSRMFARCKGSQVLRIAGLNTINVRL